MTLHKAIIALGNNALAASRELALLSTARKNTILNSMANGIEVKKESIKRANIKDMKAGKRQGLSSSMLDRLELTNIRIEAMAHMLRKVAKLRDPVGNIIRQWRRPNGLYIQKVRVPIGVIGIIYESRPNVTADAAALCFKTSNAVILRGGKEAFHSNQAIVNALKTSGGKKGLPEHAIQFVSTTERKAVRELVQMEGLVDLIMPRGGEALIKAVAKYARVPVIKHYKGICHIFVDKTADPAMALKIIKNAKCQRPGVCNAVETLLVHKKLAREFLPAIARTLGAHGVELRGDELCRSIVPSMKIATEDDWQTEYLDLILAIRIVPSIKAAIEHINHYGSRHSDAIISKSSAAQKQFTKEVDSATVYINSSTRFTDGGEFGMGAEIGISTDKIHARGPMGLEELTSYKYIILGHGQIRK